MSDQKGDAGSVESVSDLREGDRILFGDRATPLEVEEKKENDALVRGPNGGEYLLYDEEDAKHPLVAKPGNKRYSSYAEDLRRVGEWIKKDTKTWRHTGSDAVIKLAKNKTGFWTLETQRFDQNLDVPKYGFSSREKAEDEVKKVLQDNPEG
jgi:hypothetical protein